MKLAVFCLVLALVGFVAAATPSTPVWPKAFSASVVVVNVSDPTQPYFWRWFHDLSQNMARLDGFIHAGSNLPPVFTKIIVDETEKEEFIIFYPGDQVTCFERAVTRPMFNPDFSSFTFKGESLIDFVTVNAWSAKNSTSGTLVFYYEDATTREPVRFITFNSEGHEEVWTFYEFDAGEQDENLFTIADPIKAICTPESAEMINHVPYNKIKL